jgi:hypothetical protein
MDAMDQPCAAVAAIRAGAEDLAHAHARAHSRQQQQRQIQLDISGIRAFVAWFTARRAAGEVTMSSDRMIDVLPALSRRFCIGLNDARYYIGLPPEAREWFTTMPWLHATVGTASKSLSLVCERSRAPGAELREFALNFELPVAGIVKMLCCYHYLDVRWIEHTGDIRPDGTQPVRVGRDVVMTLDIRVVSQGGGFVEILDGRDPNGMQNRSAVARGPRPSSDASRNPFAVNAPTALLRRPDAIGPRGDPQLTARAPFGEPALPVPFGLKPLQPPFAHAGKDAGKGATTAMRE